MTSPPLQVIQIATHRKASKSGQRQDNHPRAANIAHIRARKEFAKWQGSRQSEPTTCSVQVRFHGACRTNKSESFAKYLACLRTTNCATPWRARLPCDNTPASFASPKTWMLS